MKKLSLFFVALFLLSYTMNAKFVSDSQVDCTKYGINSALSEAEYYGEENMYEILEAAIWYKEACEEAGGNIADPVFL